MKVTPLAQGTGVPAQSNAAVGSSPSRLEKAKAIAAGQELPQTTGDSQVDRTQVSLKKIKMKTQVSTNRDDNPVEAVPQGTEVPTIDTNEPVNTAVETKPIDPQLADLVKIKRSLQVKESELAKERAAFEAQKTQGMQNPEEYVSKADLLANPGKIFELGVSYDKLTEAIINNQNAPIDPVKLRNEIKEELKTELLGEFGNRDQQAEQQVLGEIKRDVSRLVESQPEQFEAIREAKAKGHPDFYNGKDPVTDLIHRTWKKTGEIMDVNEAAALVEQQLVDEAIPFAQLKKVQSRLTPAQAAQVEAQTPQPKPNTKVMRTLTNRDSASPIMDRRARAIAAMNGTLKKG